MCARIFAQFSTLVALFCTLAAAPRRAWAEAPPPHRAHEVELGGFLGAHFFSGSTELGRLDLDPRSPNNAPQHSFLVGLTASYAPHPRVAVEAELAFLPTSTRDGQATALILAYRAHALVHLLTGRLRPFLLLGGGGLSSVTSTDKGQLGLDTDGLFHGGAGLKLDLPRSLSLRLDGRLLLAPRIEDTLVTPEFELFLGLSYRMDLLRGRRPAPQPMLDPDGDGLRGDADRCPTEAEDRDGFEDDDGCPERDNDGDSVPDTADRCPGAAGPEATGGCPDGDGDGVADREDRCPDKAGQAAQGGCPAVAEARPATGGGGAGPGSGGDPAAAGADSDGDGVVDRDDRCPGKAESKNGFADGDGCPDALPKDLARLGALSAAVTFQKGKPLFRPPTLKALKALARALQAHPEVRLEITVRAAEGPDPAGLAERRAAVVRLYLTEIGVDGARLVAQAAPPLPKKKKGRLVTLQLAGP